MNNIELLKALMPIVSAATVSDEWDEVDDYVASQLMGIAGKINPSLKMEIGMVRLVADQLDAVVKEAVEAKKLFEGFGK